VYGTLRSHFDNDWARKLRDSGVHLGKASVPGSIYRVGHFPVYRSEPSGTVHGELYEVPDSLFTVLDDYEGEAFNRIPITLHDGREAWIYAYDSEPGDAPRIESGDFTRE